MSWRAHVESMQQWKTMVEENRNEECLRLIGQCLVLSHGIARYQLTIRWAINRPIAWLEWHTHTHTYTGYAHASTKAHNTEYVDDFPCRIASHADKGEDGERNIYEIHSHIGIYYARVVYVWVWILENEDEFRGNKTQPDIGQQSDRPPLVTDCYIHHAYCYIFIFCSAVFLFGKIEQISSFLQKIF